MDVKALISSKVGGMVPEMLLWERFNVSKLCNSLSWFGISLISRF